MLKYTIIGNYKDPMNMIRVECDSHAEMSGYKKKMLNQGYSLTIHQGYSHKDEEAIHTWHYDQEVKHGTD